MNSLKKEMPLAGGGKWEEGKLLVLLSVPKPQSEQNPPGFFLESGARRYRLCIMRAPTPSAALPGRSQRGAGHKNMAKGSFKAFPLQPDCSELEMS